MRGLTIALLAVLALLTAYAVGRTFWRGGPAPSASPEIVLRATPEASGVEAPALPARREPAPYAPGPVSAARPDPQSPTSARDAAMLATASDAEPEPLEAWLNRNPLSADPHRVVRAWGGKPGATVPVGLVVVVDPNLPTARLERLARDLRDEYADTPVFALQIFDSEEAATYDRHTDGGALADRHLVARVVRDDALDTDTIQIRGAPIEP